jgi:hypothetical protein
MLHAGKRSNQGGSASPDSIAHSLTQSFPGDRPVSLRGCAAMLVVGAHGTAIVYRTHSAGGILILPGPSAMQGRLFVEDPSSLTVKDSPSKKYAESY